MKRSARFITILLMLLSVCTLGMGVLGEGPTGKIPVPEKKFIASFVDQTDVVTECSDVSIEGNTFIEGKKGEGVYTVPFDRIRNVLFQKRGNELRGVVRLSDGSEVELVLNKERKAYGKTEFGTFQIRLADLKKLTISAR